MSRWLVLPLVVLPYIATAASGAAPPDRDHDRLSDRWEKRYGLSTSRTSTNGDPDHDGLRNLREYRVRTHPRRKDTDRDGLRDGAEIRRHRTDPRRKDTDGDGYADGVEVRAGTNPRTRGDHPSGSAPSPAPAPQGFPDASNTGVRPGTVLVPSGGLTINTAGAVVEGREITGQVVVNAPNVTIRNSRIRSNAMWVIDNNSTGLVVEDSEIGNRPVAGEPNCHNGIGNSNLTVRRSEISGCENAVNVDRPGNVSFVANFVHDLDTEGPSHVWGADPHTDGIQVGQAASNLVIRGNWIDPSPGGGVTAPIIMYTGSGTPNSRVWIEDNHLDARGASYALYAPRSPTHEVFVSRNRMYRGVAGYTGCVRVGVTVTAFDDNRDAGTGARILPDNGAGGGCSN